MVTCHETFPICQSQNNTIATFWVSLNDDDDDQVTGTKSFLIFHLPTLWANYIRFITFLKFDKIININNFCFEFHLVIFFSNNVIWCGKMEIWLILIYIKYLVFFKWINTIVVVNVLNEFGLLKLIIWSIFTICYEYFTWK